MDTFLGASSSENIQQRVERTLDAARWAEQGNRHVIIPPTHSNMVSAREREMELDHALDQDSIVEEQPTESQRTMQQIMDDLAKEQPDAPSMHSPFAAPSAVDRMPARVQQSSSAPFRTVQTSRFEKVRAQFLRSQQQASKPK